MTLLADFDIRYSEMSDLSSLSLWFSNPNACDDFPFGPEEKDDALKNWIGFSKFKASLTGILQNEPCAVGTLFLMPYKKVAHHAAFYLIVDEKHRRKGIGTSMLLNLMNLAKTRFKLESLHAEVYEPSHLLPLLKKQRFEVFATQDDFVHLGECTRPRVLLEHFFS
jgi:RimJ/RimL family protein N-acetyltransferase